VDHSHFPLIDRPISGRARPEQALTSRVSEGGRAGGRHNRERGRVRAVHCRSRRL